MVRLVVLHFRVVHCVYWHALHAGHIFSRSAVDLRYGITLGLGPVPTELHGLTQVQETLISAVMPMMSLYRLPQGKSRFLILSCLHSRFPSPVLSAVLPSAL